MTAGLQGVLPRSRVLAAQVRYLLVARAQEPSSSSLTMSSMKVFLTVKTGAEVSKEGKVDSLSDSSDWADGEDSKDAVVDFEDKREVLVSPAQHIESVASIIATSIMCAMANSSDNII